ncbi:MAG: DUF6048 family protein [Weeksellaceae bacterium]|nr:DUF6048 family protein [Weeksellaceae bacterium]
MFTAAQQIDSIIIRPSTSSPLFVGVDIVAPAFSIFSDQIGGEILLSKQVYNQWHAAAEVGYHINAYNKGAWDVEVSGVFTRIGFNYVISQDIENANNIFYLGARIGYSPFALTVNRYIIQGYDAVSAEGSLPAHTTHSIWLEPLGGARVKLFNTNFYADASARLRINAFYINPHGINSLVMPGFGQSQSGLGFGLIWAVGYQIPLSRSSNM